MPPKVLLADDDPAVVRLFSLVLELEGLDVRTASSAQEAIKLLAQESFDLVITDIRMETPTAGFDVVRTARQLSPRPSILILTAHPVPANDWKRAGADAFFVKGGDVRKLVDAVLALVRLRQAAAGVMASSEHRQVARTAEPV